MVYKEIKVWDEETLANLKCYLLSDSKEFNTGRKKPAIIICPGGGYLGTSDRESEPIALKFASEGYHAFVLEYNTYFGTHKGRPDYSNMPPINKKSIFPQPLLDLSKAIRLVREMADEYFIDKDKIVLCGFSAGGNLVANQSVKWHEKWLSESLSTSSDLIKPNAVILGYPLTDYILMKEEVYKKANIDLINFWKISNTSLFGKEEPSDEELLNLSPARHVTKDTPPTFIWHTANDSMVYVSNTIVYGLALSKNNVSFEMHIFEKGPHGLSMCDKTTAVNEEQINPHCKNWIKMSLEFLDSQFNNLK